MSNSLDKSTLDTFKKVAIICRAFNHELRQEILKYLHQKGEANVTSIYVYLRLEQSVASQNLAILRNAGFVKRRRNGKEIYYSINYDRLQKYESSLLAMMSQK